MEEAGGPQPTNPTHPPQEQNQIPFKMNSICFHSLLCDGFGFFAQV